TPMNDDILGKGLRVQATKDDPGVPGLAMYPKQPFDIAGRTGVVVFDVSDDSHGDHRAWPEFWYTDKPVPAPLIHGDGTSWSAVPKDGLNIMLSGDCAPGTGCGACPDVTSYRRVGF